MTSEMFFMKRRAARTIPEPTATRRSTKTVNKSTMTITVASARGTSVRWRRPL